MTKTEKEVKLEYLRRKGFHTKELLKVAEKALDDGFKEDAILFALEFTLMQIQKASPEYTRRILASWHKANLLTLDTIKNYEKSRMNVKKESPKAPFFPVLVCVDFEAEKYGAEKITSTIAGFRCKQLAEGFIAYMSTVDNNKYFIKERG